MATKHPSQEKSWHAYVVRGPAAASADFTARTIEDARQQAAKAWEEDLGNIAVHPTSDCERRRCHG